MDDYGRRRAREVAMWARDLYEGKITREEYYSRLDDADYDNPLLEELVDLIEHQPKKSRWLGLSGKAYDDYIARVRRLIDHALAADAETAGNTRRE